MIYSVKKTVKGNVKGQVLVFRDSLSFNGDIDIGTGRVMTNNSGLQGESIAEKILLFRENKGSSGGAMVLQALSESGLMPKAMVSVKSPDFNLVEAAILTGLPYASLIDEESLVTVRSGQTVDLDLEKGTLEVVQQ